MRKRYQEGSLTKVAGRWIAQWWEDGHRRKRTLGLVSKTPKSQARAELAAILAPINSRAEGPSPAKKWGEFVTEVYLPFFRRKWKHSTAVVNESRLNLYLVPVFGERTLGSITRGELQDLLDAKAAAGLSFSVCAHLRWDFKQIFAMAVNEGHIARSPAEILFVPREAKRPEHVSMNLQEVWKCFTLLEQRERLIVKFAILAGLRPGEILALQWRHLTATHAEIQQRLYMGKIDTPKTPTSYRRAALSAGLLGEIEQWRAVSMRTGPDDWVFPCEHGRTPVAAANVWNSRIGPRLEEAGLGWVNFQVMRRTHSTLMNELHDDPKLVADQLGHTVDVNQHVYTRASVERRRVAVDALENALPVM